jgi:serine/threonine-protein kinase
MGPVYEGEHVRTRSPCLVKVFDVRHRRDSHRVRSARRWLREAASASRLSHPNIAVVFDQGETPDGTYFVATERLGGRTLEQEIEEVGRIQAQRVVRIAQQVCLALNEAHAAGIVHRDLNPSNVLLTGDGDSDPVVKVLNFGLAIDTHELDASDESQLGPILGSPAYMAPEQVQGTLVDGRADIYALGAMMYAMIEGQPPFVRATGLATMMAQVSDPPPPMQSSISDALERIVMTCLAKRPDDRYPTVTDLAGALVRLGTAPTKHSLAPVRSATVVRRSARPSILRMDPVVYLVLVIVLGVLNVALLAKRFAGPVRPVGSPIAHQVAEPVVGHPR